MLSISFCLCLDLKTSPAFYKFFQKNKKYNIYVARFSKTKNQFTNSKPCQQCSQILKKYGFKFIIYSQDNDMFKKENIKDIKNTHISKGIQYCSNLIKEK